MALGTYQTHDLTLYGRSPVEEPRLYSGRRPLFSWVTDGRQLHSLALEPSLGASTLRIGADLLTLDSFLSRGGGPPCDERTPLLAYGSDAAPGTHKHKGLTYVPAFEAGLFGLELCFLKLKVHGYVPHTLVRRPPKHPRFVFVLLLADGDWPKVLQHEQIGTTHELVQLQEGHLRLANGQWLGPPLTVLPRAEVPLCLEKGQPVPAHQYTQEHLWRIFGSLGEDPCRRWVSAAAADPPPRQPLPTVVLPQRPATDVPLARPHL